MTLQGALIKAGVAPRRERKKAIRIEVLIGKKALDDLQKEVKKNLSSKDKR